MNLLYFISIFLLFSYSVLVIILIIGWLKIPFAKVISQNNTTFITIIIPIRNEENNIGKLLQDIDNQLYNRNLFEVIVVNDASTDNSKEIVTSLISKVNYQLQILDLPSNIRLNSPKKAAITLAIANAKGSLIITTDGDCRVGNGWLKCFADKYELSNAKLISGPVTFFDSSTFFSKIQTVEFASLIGTGAASIFYKNPNMCNGANLGYEKAAFEAVGGFSGFETQPSGDDEFLMHKIANKYPNDIVFLKNSNAIVNTAEQPNIASFVSQRRRWASKWNAYEGISTTLLAMFILISNLFLLFTVYCLFAHFNIILFSFLIFRVFIEIIFLALILTFLNRKSNIFLIPLVQAFYPFYVVIIGALSLQKKYQWKERNY